MKAIQSTNEELLALEQSLKNRFQPIKPDQKFVGELRSQLEASPVYQQQRKTAFFLLSVAGGLFVGLIIFLIGKGFFQELKMS
jgi:hypothetical protein